jgi:hypothetical protein
MVCDAYLLYWGMTPEKEEEKRQKHKNPIKE